MKGEDRNIEAIQRRTKRYWYDDGLTEIAAGCLLLLVGLLFFVERSVPPSAFPPYFSAIGLPILIIFGTWIARRIVAALKERLTYPRTGYVSYRRPGASSRIVTVVVAVVVAALVSVLLRSWPSSDQWIPALEGISIAVFLLYLGHTLGLTRFHLLALVSAVVGTYSAVAGLGETLGTAVYFAALGTAVLASGVLTLRRYLGKTRPARGN